MNKIVGLTIVAFAILLSVAAEPTSAQSPHLGGGCYGHFGYSSFGIMGSPYSLGQIPVPPYFALHPPVYYSQPVPRTYGYTPFAYPGTKETPALIAPQAAKVIKNPYMRHRQYWSRK